MHVIGNLNSHECANLVLMKLVDTVISHLIDAAIIIKLKFEP